MMAPPGAVESYTTVAKVESTQTMDALKSTRAQVGEESLKRVRRPAAVAPGDRPDPSRS